MIHMEDMQLFVSLLIPPDADECLMDIDNCHLNTECVNTIGSFECQCLPGFTGDGFNCQGKYHMHILVSTQCIM